MSADSDAFQTVKLLPGLTPTEQQYLLSVARGEGFYGLGWGNPGPATIKLSEEFGIDPRAGAGSNNWGAEQGKGSAGSFPHVDHDSSGKPFVAQYRKHKTAVEGAASVARVLLKDNLKAALNTGFYPGPVMRFPKPTTAQKSQFEFKKRFSGQTLKPLEAAVFTQSDNGYYELHPEKYLEAANRNYAKLTANLKWSALLLGSVAPPLVPGEGSLGLSSSEPDSSFSGSLPHRPVLRSGDSGNAVKILQEVLNKRGFSLKEDGIFGNKTLVAVLTFQSANQLKRDGVVGPLTWNQLGG
jgi:hypothetical protein